jgi:hypothetical protein
MQCIRLEAEHSIVPIPCAPSLMHRSLACVGMILVGQGLVPRAHVFLGAAPRSRDNFEAVTYIKDDALVESFNASKARLPILEPTRDPRGMCANPPASPMHDC